MTTKSKTESEFPCISLDKFGEIWQTGDKNFTLLGASFSGKTI